MSKFRFAAIAAIVAALPLASVDAFGDASDAELAYVDFVSAPPDCDFGWHSHNDWRHHLAVVRLPNRKKLTVHHWLHPSTVVRRESTRVVVADNKGVPVPLVPQTVAGYPRCENLGCSGFLVLGVTY